MENNLKMLLCSIKEAFQNDKEQIADYINHRISAQDYEKIPGIGHEEKAQYIVENGFDEEHKNPVDKKKIALNILVANNNFAKEEIKWLSECFDITVLKHDEINSEKVDLVLFTGGEDVSTEIYGENKGKYTNCNKTRDNLEESILNSYYNVPKLGICRGSQFLTVYSGGKLIQHVTGHGRNHEIEDQKGKSYEITSTHHQMMFPFEMSQLDYKIIAHSKYFNSSTYLNGNDEEIKRSADFLECEIVYYPSTKALCIQGHPEYSNCPQKTKDMCLSLVKEYLINKK
jgi:gamma-glutamyl-gamma-aminobutyrate hydrolase PuuD